MSRLPSDKAARRLLDVCQIDHDEEEVGRAASLACALGAVLRNHIVTGAAADESVEAAAMVNGLAATVGWVLSLAPPATWPAALALLDEQARGAALAHAAHRHPGPTIQ